jgi:hypothetical protein
VSGPAALGSLAGLNFTAEDAKDAEVGTPGVIRGDFRQGIAVLSPLKWPKMCGIY